MTREINVFNNIQELADTLAKELRSAIEKKSDSGEMIYIALSGGKTPRIFFDVLAKPPYLEEIPWEIVNLFWGDERCVPPNDSESNFKMAYDAFISKVNIPDDNVHRIIGENPPELEVNRYAKEIQTNLPDEKNVFPVFDWIFLGMGNDGHTASLFPNALTLHEKTDICVIAEHPSTGQKRISLSLPVINNARRVSFLVTGEEKAPLLKEILEKGSTLLPYPASKINPTDGLLEWYIDKAAAPEQYK